MKLSLIATVLGIIVGSNVRAQSQSLRISSPSSGTVIRAGETLKVVVENSDPESNRWVALVSSEGSLGIAPLQAGKPVMTFQMAVPASTHSGTYLLFAVSRKAESEDVRPASDIVEIVVQQGKPLGTLSPTPPRLAIPYPGASEQLLIYSVTGPLRRTLTQEDGLTVTAEDASIASVDQGFQINGLRPGSTNLKISMASQTILVPVTVFSVTVRGDFNNSGNVDTNDIDILQLSFGQVALSSDDARDLNRDGRIDALDARVLTTLCTRPRCAAK